MVGTIHPIVYREHQLRWVVASLTHLFGNVVAALFVGSLVGMLGQWITSSVVGPRILLLSVLAPISLLYSLAEIGLIKLPYPQWDRQVPVIWRRIFSPGITALFYGLSLGTGITTRIITGTIYIVILGIVVWGDAMYAALTFSLFGLGRAIPVWMLSWHLRSRTSIESFQPFVNHFMNQLGFVHVLNAFFLALAGGYWLAS